MSVATSGGLVHDGGFQPTFVIMITQPADTVQGSDSAGKLEASPIMVAEIYSMFTDLTATLQTSTFSPNVRNHAPGQPLWTGDRLYKLCLGHSELVNLRES